MGANRARFPKDLRPLIKALEERGWRVELTNGNHVKFIDPDGTIACVTGSSPGRPHAQKRRVEAHLRQHERRKQVGAGTGADLPDECQ
jgi:predicted RNA binding protein YcfA (HicA-like mRNA interferase family)